MGQGRKRAVVTGAVLALGLAGAGVGGVVAQAKPAIPTVNLTLKEFSITPMPKLKAGKVTFVAANKGTIPHALAVTGPGVSMRTAPIAPGKTAKLTVTLRNGSYTIRCPLANHAALGMRLTAKVGGATSAPAPAPTATTSGNSGGGAGGYDTSTGGAWG